MFQANSTLVQSSNLEVLTALSDPTNEMALMASLSQMNVTATRDIQTLVFILSTIKVSI